MTRPTGSDHQEFALARVQQEMQREARDQRSAQVASPPAPRRAAPARMLGIAAPQWLVVATAVAVATAITGWCLGAVVAPAWVPQAGPVYEVTGLREALLRHPAGWAGRIVLVHALFGNCIPGIDPPAQCRPWQPALFEASGHLGTAPLPVVVQPASDLLDGLRHMPLVRSLIPAPHVTPTGAPAIYRVQLVAVSRGPLGSSIQYRVLLLTRIPSLPPAAPEGAESYPARHPGPM